MLTRFMIQSSVPVNQVNFLAEIQNLVNVLLSNADSTVILDRLNIEPWTIFEFKTERRGCRGPTKVQCLSYYSR